MNQAEKQFMFNLQLFNDGEAAPAADPTPQEAPAEPPTEPQNAPATTPEDSPIDYSELSKSKQPDDQLAFLKKNGFIGSEKKPDTPEPKKTEEPPTGSQANEQPPVVDPEFEIKVNGEVKKVKQSELVELAQKGADYTRKTQELADQRRQLELLLQQQAGAAQKPMEQATPAVKAEQEYRNIVAQTEKNLGLEPGGFNQFDAVHQFELQRVTMQHNSEQAAKQQVEHRLNSFVQTANQDPLTPQVDANFDAYIYKMGAEGGDGAAKASAIMSAKTRFLSGAASMADLDLLESHWNYVKAAIAAPATPPAPPKPTPVPAAKPQVEPPKTETPGNSVTPPRERINYEKLGHLKQSDQLNALRKAGYLKRG